MRWNEFNEAAGVGRITKQNQTADVGPDEVKKQAAKFGNTVDKDGRPPTLSKKVKGSKTNVLFNLGLAESKMYECPRTKAASCQCESVNKVTEAEETVTAVCTLEQSDTVKGTILFKQQANGPTLIVGEITGLEPGEHGFHIHEFGDLSKGCESAGGHYNPDGVDHGDLEQGHVGDLGNIIADDNGTASIKIMAKRVDLTGERSIVGRSVVVHADVDDLGKGGDEESLKTGNAGDRLACGVILLKETVNENIQERKLKSKSYKKSLKAVSASGKRPKRKLRTKFNEGYKLQLERDTDMMVLHIVDTATGKRTEVRGKPGYETNYDPNDKLHMLLDKVGKSANISDLMNGEVVGINPKHPDATKAKAATSTAFNEALDNPYPFKLSGPSDSQGFVATAQTPNGVLRMDFETTDYDNFSIDFAVGKSMGKTDAGDEFRVFATVVAMMKEWISTVGIEHVEEFDFAANKTEHASGGREKLYTRFAKKLASQLGWKLEQSTTADRSTAFFKLTNPKPVPRDDEYWDALEENFADGKKKGKSRPGRVKRAGASCNGSVTDLRKRAKNSSGEKAKMYHWCANMKSGRKKK